MTESLNSIRALAAPAPNGADPTPEQLVAAAIALRPRLRELQGLHAELGGYSEEIYQAFHAARFYDILKPKRYGGLQYPLRVFFQVALELTRGDPGVGWSYLLSTGHAYQMGSYFSERAQEEAFAADPFIAPSRAIPMGTATPVEGGYIVDGTWDYCSGSNFSSHFMPVAPVINEDGSRPLLMFVVKREDYTILDDWGGDRTLGLQASSSNSITVDKVFVPEHMAVPYDFKGHQWADTGTVGYQLHGDPLYLGRSLVYFYSGLVTTPVGAAWAALDEWEALMQRPTSFPPRVPRTESAEYQLWYGRLLSLVDASTTLLLSAQDIAADASRFWTEGGPEYAIREDARVRGIVLRAAELASEAVMLAIQTAGSSASKGDSKLGKYARDVLMYRTHIGAQFDALYAANGRTAITGEPPTT